MFSRYRSEAKRLIAKIMLVCTVLSNCVLMSGCDVALTDVITQDSITALGSRIDQNKEVIKQMYYYGIITEKQRNSLNEYFDNMGGIYNKIASKVSSADSVSDLESVIATDSDIKGLRNAVSRVFTTSTKLSSDCNIKSAKSGSSLIPLGAKKSAVGDSISEVDDAIGNIYVYTISSKYLSSNTIEDVIERIEYWKKAVQRWKNTGVESNVAGNEAYSPGSIAKMIERDSMFEKTEGIDGKPVKLFPDDTKIIRDSCTFDGTRGIEYNRTKIGYDYTINSYASKDVNVSSFGKDSVSYNSGDGVPAVAIRLREMNTDVVDKIIDAESGTGMYTLFGTIAILSAYPVYRPKAMVRIDSTDGKTSTVGIKNKDGSDTLEKTQLFYNVVSGAVYRNTDEYDVDYVQTLDGTVPQQKVYIGKYTDITNSEQGVKNTGIKYESTVDLVGDGLVDIAGFDGVVGSYRRKGSMFFNSKELSTENYSFYISDTYSKKSQGYALTSVNSLGDSVKFTVECPVIILKDYVEAAPAPTMPNGYIITGRRLRFTEEFLENGVDINEAVAVYIDNVGANMFPEASNTKKSTVRITGNDLVGIESNTQALSLVKSSEGVKVSSTISGDSNSSTEFIQADARKKVGVDSIDGWATIALTGRVPYNTEKVPLSCNESKYETDYNTYPMYCVKVFKSPYATYAYNAWLNTTTELSNSYAWWIRWLDVNGFMSSGEGVNDRIHADDSTENKAGTDSIELNKDTLVKLQAQIDEDENSKRASAIKTIFIVLGYIMMCYSVLLPSAWVYDTNVSSGPRLLGIVSLGKWMAVHDSEEANALGGTDTICVGMKDVIWRSILVMSIGILLISGNALVIILKVVEMLSTLVKVLWETIFK